MGMTGAALVLGACGNDDENATSDTAAPGPPSTDDLVTHFSAFTTSHEPNGNLKMVSWPEFILASPSEVQDLYAFHITSGELMKYMPCYCGCKGSNHRNNRDCYIQQVNADGSVVFDAMAPT